MKVKTSYIDNFLEYLNTEKNFSDFTIKSYKKDLNDLFSFINKNPLDIEEQDIKSYLSVLYDKKLSTATICRKISTFKSFYSFLILKKQVNKNPLENIGYPKREKKLPTFLYYDKLEELINESKKGEFGLRNSLIIELLYATGLRVNELVNIKLSDIDFSNKTIIVLGKGSVERLVYFGDYSKEILQRYIDEFRKEKLKNQKHDFLLINKNGGALSDRGVRLIIEGILKTMSINNKISPHTLRHTFATHLLENGCDIKVVQELLGHKHLTTTEIYTHVTNEKLREVYFKCHPRSGKNKE